MLIFMFGEFTWRLLTRLGLQRPAVPRCVVHGRFDIAGVTVINPTRGKREGQTIAVADGEIAAISAAKPAVSGFSGCFACPA